MTRVRLAPGGPGASEIASTSVAVDNQLAIPIDVFGRDPTTNRTSYAGTLKPTQSKTFAIAESALRVLVTGQGSIVLDRDVAAISGTLTIDPLILTSPNHLPPPTAPSVAMPIPPDSVPWVVGVGRFGAIADGIVFLREQFWHKGPESFALPPRSSLQKILRQTSGRTSSSSTSDQVTQELSLTAGAGWGPFSAAASASFSTTSQRTDTVTIREESSSAIVQTFRNDADTAVVVCLWQLVDRIRVFKKDKAVAAIDNGQIPLIPLSYEVS